MQLKLSPLLNSIIHGYVPYIWTTQSVTCRRFPVISGFRVTWDSRRPAGQRVISVYHEESNPDIDNLISPVSSEPGSGAVTPSGVNNNVQRLEEVKNESGGRKYAIVTREYMAGGHDGYTPLLDKPFLITIEEGQVMSTIVRKYLMGMSKILVSQSPRRNEVAECKMKVNADKNNCPPNPPRRTIGATYIKRMCADTLSPREHLHFETAALITREKAKDAADAKARTRAKDLWKSAIQHVKSFTHSRRHYRNMISIVNREHMSEVDCVDGKKMRSGEGETQEVKDEESGNYFVIHPVVDGRFKDLGRP